MKLIKFSKSDYIAFINIIGTLISLVVFLTCDFLDESVNDGIPYSTTLSLYLLIATLWCCLFIPTTDTMPQKRWLTKNEKWVLFFIMVAINIIAGVIKIFIGFEGNVDLNFLMPAIVTIGVWLLFYITGPKGKSTDKETIKSFYIPSDNPFIFESNYETLKAFNVGTSWYNAKKYTILCDTYITTAKEFSGIKTKQEIELFVRERIVKKQARRIKILSFIALAAWGVILLIPGVDNGITGLCLMVAGACQISVVLGFASGLHGPITPNESAELKQKETIEKSS